MTEQIMTEQHIIKQMDKGVLRLRLNRPSKLNALTPEMYSEIGDQVLAAANNPECRVIILSGNGRAFSSGFDLNLELADRSHSSKLENIRDVANRARWAIWESPKPVIAEIHGYCLGGAFELMLPCDFTIASEDCQLGEPEIQFGAGPAYMMVPWLTGHKVAKSVLMTGRRISAQEAFQIGFVSKVVDAQELSQSTDKLVKTLIDIPACALRMTKSGINRAYETMGMRGHLDAWAESTAYLSYIVKEEGSTFKNILKSEGTASAIAWRNSHFKSDS